MKYLFSVRGHWWFDAGLVGLYMIAQDLLVREEVGVSGKKLWPDVKVMLEPEGIVIDAPGRVEPFIKACYEELAARWWNRSMATRIQNPELVCYDQETDELKCLPKRMPTPVANLSVSAAGWRVRGDPFEDLAKPLQERVTSFLEEHKKSLWGAKKKLCYEQPVCHPKWEDMKVFDAPKRGKGQVCSVCGRTAVCDKVSQTSFPLFASHSATFTFDSELGVPDLICGECQLLGKFAVQSAFYKKVGDLTYILQFSGGDISMLLDAHEIFGAGSKMRLNWHDAQKIYFSNFDEEKTALQYARLTYEILWGMYLKAYDLILENQKKRYQGSQASRDDWDDEELDADSLKRTAVLNVILLALGSKGNTFITKEIVSYSDTAYVFRLISYLKKFLKAESNEALKRDMPRFFEFLFLDFLLPNPDPRKKYDPMNGMDRNRILQLVFEKKSIVQHVERFVFKRSMSDYPWLARILFFVTRYGAALCSAQEGEKKLMNEEQILIAKNLGSQIVMSAKEVLLGDDGGTNSLKSVKGDLFTLRKTRTATDFLEQLNRLQFRYGIVVNHEIAEGILAKPDIPFEDFKAYCMISALNAYNNAMRPNAPKDGDEN